MLRDQTLRTVLFAPGNEPSKLAKVASFGADVVVLDLEDAVAIAEKDAARGLVREALAALPAETSAIVRVNGPETGRLRDDIAAVVCPELACVMVPKVERPSTLVEVDRMLEDFERVGGLEPGSIGILPLVETAAGIVRCEEIAAAATDRLITLVFGLGDFTADVDIDVGPDWTELLYARSRVVVAARAAGLAPPIDGPYLALRDFDGLEADSRRSRRLGFQGRVVVYPPQVDPVRRAYSEVTSEEHSRARRVVEAFELAEAGGSASIQVDGGFVDYPIYRRALRKLALHDDAAGARG
jgi:citrate lyase subunit beta/citryl-CoA lyase